MRRLLLVLTGLSLTVAGIDAAEISRTPDQTLLWNKFSAVRIIDGYAVALAVDGIAVCEWDPDQHTFVQVGQLFLDDTPTRLRQFGDVLALKTLSDSIIFIDVSHLPELSRLGALSPGTEFDDFVLHGQDLYLSVWFDGVWRFRSDNGHDWHFVDSTMRPILCTKMQLLGDTLCILDEYNGVARFDLTDAGFGRFMDYLWAPFQVKAIFPYGDRLILSRINNGVFVGESGHSGSGIVDTISLGTSPRFLFLRDSLLVMVCERVAQVYNANTYDSLGQVALGDNPVDGDVLFIEGENKLLLPEAGGGLVLYSLGHLGSAQAAFARPGPVSSLFLYDGLLFTGGIGNPVDVYSVAESGRTDYDYTLLGSLPQVGGLDHNGDTMFVFFSGLDRLALVTDCANPDSALIENAVSISPVGAVGRIEYVPRWDDSLHALVVRGERQVSAYAFDDSSGLSHWGSWGVGGKIDAAVVRDSLVIAAIDKRMLMFYRVNPDRELDFLAALALAWPAHELMLRDNHVLCFSEDELLWVTFADPSRPHVDTVIDLALPVNGAAAVGEYLYTTGARGIAVYNLATRFPELVASGGRPGGLIAADSNVIVTSDGNQVNVYAFKVGNDSDQPPLPADFALAQNYPNPFNATTTIGYSLKQPEPVQLTIYNALGQRVRTLVDACQEAGLHRVTWDGTTAGGASAATGVYFYRLQMGSVAATRKMLLLR